MQIELSLTLQKANESSLLYIPSAVAIKGRMPELDFYVCELMAHGLWRPEEVAGSRRFFMKGEGQRVLLEREGQETIAQIHLAYALAEREKAELVVVSTITHYWRVRYLCQYLYPKVKVAHEVAFGTPNLVEAVTDSILTFAFPVMVNLGLANWFQRWAVRHREEGKHI